MAGMLKPYDSAAGGTLNGPGYNMYGDGSDKKKWNSITANSSVDPRLSGGQRLDQRYQNYQYGPTPDYATNKATDLQTQGSDAQRYLFDYGGQAWGEGTQALNRSTPTTDYYDANAALQNATGTAWNQGDLYNRFTAFADQGPGPSIAQAQLDANTAQAMNQQLALAGSGRGAGGGAAQYRQAAANQAQLAGQANAQASILQATEADQWRQRQLQSLGMGGETLSQQGQLDLGMASQYANQSQFLTDAEIEAQAQRDQAALGYEQLGLQGMQQSYLTQLGYEQEARENLQNEAQANQAYEQNLTSLATGQMSLQNSREQREAESSSQWTGAMLGGLAAAGGIALMASDEDEKKDIHTTDLSSRYAALANDDDYTSAGWYQPGSQEQQLARQADNAQAANLERLKQERERESAERERAERQRKLGAIQSLVGAVSGPFMR